jgi:tRNA pseudouridine55 synthase
MILRKLKLHKIKVGHGGTLDPLASGLVVVCVGKETKNQESHQGQNKEYEAELTLGATTPSYDKETPLENNKEYAYVTRDLIHHVITTSFAGTIMQVPPLYSAKSIDGTRAYELAREGSQKKLEPQQITIHSIDIISFNAPKLMLRVNCSKGTYIRSLAHDIGKELGCGAHLSGLRRTRSGEYHVGEAMKVSEFNDKISHLVKGKQ